jgi:predicted transcriptional regulator
MRLKPFLKNRELYEVGKAMSPRNPIQVEFDEMTQEYYAIWQPIVMGMGGTRGEALDDLREAAHCCVDTFIDISLKDKNNKKEG